MIPVHQYAKRGIKCKIQTFSLYSFSDKRQLRKAKLFDDFRDKQVLFIFIDIAELLKNQIEYRLKDKIKRFIVCQSFKKKEKGKNI